MCGVFVSIFLFNLSPGEKNRKEPYMFGRERKAWRHRGSGFSRVDHVRPMVGCLFKRIGKGPGHLEIWPLNKDLDWPYRFLSRMASLLTSFVGETLAKTRKISCPPQTNECLKWRLFWPFLLGGTLPKMNKTWPKSGPVFFLATNIFRSQKPEAPHPIIFRSWARASPCTCPALLPACTETIGW